MTAVKYEVYDGDKYLFGGISSEPVAQGDNDEVRQAGGRFIYRKLMNCSVRFFVICGMSGVFGQHMRSRNVMRIIFRGEDETVTEVEGYVASVSGAEVEFIAFKISITKPEPDIYAILANLTRRVKSLESQLRDTQGNVERQAQELGNLEGRTKVIDSISDFYAEGQR